MSTYIYTPKRDNRMTILFAVGFLITAALLYFCAGKLPIQPYIMQLAAVLLAALGIHMVIRWQVTSFRYELHDTNLVVVKCMQKRECMVCDLTLSTYVGLFEESEREARFAVAPRLAHVYNYTVNFQPKRQITYVFSDADTHCALLLEPDDAFLSEMKMRIEIATKNKPEDL